MNFDWQSSRTGNRRLLAMRVVKEMLRLPKGAKLMIVSGSKEEATALLEEVKRVSKEIGLDAGDFDWQLKTTNKNCPNTM